MKQFIAFLFLVGCSTKALVPIAPAQTERPVLEDVVSSPIDETSPRVTWTLVATDEQYEIVSANPCRLTYLRHIPTNPITEEVLVECKMSSDLIGTLKTQCRRDGEDQNSVRAQIFTLSVTLSCQSN